MHRWLDVAVSRFANVGVVRDKRRGNTKATRIGNRSAAGSRSVRCDAARIGQSSLPLDQQRKGTPAPSCASGMGRESWRLCEPAAGSGVDGTIAAQEINTRRQISWRGQVRRDGDDTLVSSIDARSDPSGASVSYGFAATNSTTPGLVKMSVAHSQTSTATCNQCVTSRETSAALAHQLFEER